jgi:cellulose biosynthesis protein BcsQ
MKSIAFFNNKGGVGKTTLLCNLSAFLATQKNAKILVIDADPQCNATQNLFSEKTVDRFYSRPSFTIHTIIKPLASGKGFSKTFDPAPSDNFGVDVIPGDPRLALTEDLLATDWGRAISGDVRGLRTTYLFAHLLSMCKSYDYVVFDMGPSLGSINRAVLLAVDFFITPMSTDIFSIKAIENISAWMKKWRAQLNAGLANNEEPAELEIEDPEMRLKFAGYVTQQYTAKRDEEGKRRAVSAFEKIMRQVPEVIKDELIASLQPNLTTIDYELGGIPTLHSLLPLSQTSRRPIFLLSGRDGVVGAHFTKVREYRETINTIADRLLSNLEALS